MIDWIIYFVIAAAVYYWITLPPTGFPPGPPRKPFFGSFPILKPKPLPDMMEDLGKEYGPLVGMKLGFKNAVLVCGPEEVLEMIKHEKAQGRPNFDRTREDPRKGIVFSDYGSFWLEQRKFTSRHLREFGFGKTSMDDMVLSEADEFSEIISKKKRVKVVGLFSLSSINVLWAMMSGQRFSLNDPLLKELQEGLDKVLRSPVKSFFLIRRLKLVQKWFPQWSGAYETEKSERDMANFFEKVFKEHRQTKTDTPRDFIDAYLQELEKPNHKPSFSEKTMMAVCMDLFSAGAESVSNALAWIVLYLVLYPEWQKKVFQEIDSFLGKDGRVRLDDRNRMPLVEAFLTEVSRINTIAPMTVPRKATGDIHYRGYLIPKDTVLFISLRCVLKDKVHWGDPNNFRPERFLNQDGSYRKDDRVLLFGGGKRFCIGDLYSKEFIFVYFVDLVQKFEFKIPEGYPEPSTDPMPGATVTPHQFEVDVIRRS